MMRRITRAGVLGLALAACSDRQTVTAPPVMPSAVVGGDHRADDDSRENGSRGAVFAMTNHPSGNTIHVFSRGSDGSLTSAGTYATGGLGTGGGSDPLRSQGSLILSERGVGSRDEDSDGRGNNSSGRRLLFAVNAGSNEISVFAVHGTRLTLVDKTPSGGVRPTSLTLRRNLLYVLHAGSGTIDGFRVGRNGKLSPLAGSTRPITGSAAADPAQVEFTPDGKLLVVTGKNTNVIDTYRIDRGGRPSGPRQNASHGMTPFGFAFHPRGNLVVSEAFGGAPQQSAMSSYRISRDGQLTVISGSVRDFQTASCWVVITDNGRYAYTSNTGSSSVSSYRIRSNGSLTLLESIAATTDPGSAPIDMALSTGSRYLYVLNGVVGTIDGYRVEEDGGLTAVGRAGGLPPYTQGIAAE
jgi:6-phosphogluconolactonase (cycloisomerase 2 family)